MAMSAYEYIMSQCDARDIRSWEAYHRAISEGREDEAEQAYQDGLIMNTYDDEVRG